MLSLSYKVFKYNTAAIIQHFRKLLFDGIVHQIMFCCEQRNLTTLIKIVVPLDEKY